MSPTAERARKYSGSNEVEKTYCMYSVGDAYRSHAGDSFCALTGSDEDEVTSPAKPAASTIPPAVDMAGHPYGYCIVPHSMHLPQSGQGIDDETINFVLSLLQLEAQLRVTKETWTFLPSTFRYNLLDG